MSIAFPTTPTQLALSVLTMWLNWKDTISLQKTYLNCFYYRGFIIQNLKGEDKPSTSCYVQL